MAIMINRIDQDDPQRNGERMVFDWFSKESVPGTVYYSFWQANHRHKLFGEVDFLYVCSRGILCVEVKGGTSIYREDKIWHSVTRNNEVVEIHNPFDQGRECQYALEEYLKKAFRTRNINFIIGHAVIFPECRFTGVGEDIIPNIVFDGKQNIDDFGIYLSKVFDFWEQTIAERYGFAPSKIDNDFLTKINTVLRGDFHVVPSLNLQFQHNAQKMIELTEKQYDVLDMIEDNPRMMVHGAAGTGKSLLAMEMIRRCDALGKKSLYLCYNKNMERYADISVSPNVNHKIKTFHSLALELLGKQAYYTLNVNELSEKLLSEFPEEFIKYDTIIIDEGQDLLYPSCAEVINKLLVNGLENGNWIMFLDVNQNIFTKIADCEFTIEYIKSIGRPVIYTLKENCRNSKDIAMKTSLLTQTEAAKYTRLDGPETKFIQYEDSNDFIKQFRRELQSLLSYGISVDNIVILSKYSLSNSVISEKDSICGCDIIEKSDVSSISIRDLNYFTIQSFKGLESKAVFLIDVDSFLSDSARALNYVGMSRAQTMLYVFYTKNSQGEYLEAIQNGLKGFRIN